MLFLLIEVQGTGRVLIDRSENVNVRQAYPSLGKNIIFAPKEQHADIAKSIIDGTYESTKDIKAISNMRDINDFLLREMGF
jgi:hypothetical protein